MPRTAKRLYGPAQIATGPATVYTVPALTKTIIRQIHVSNPSGSAVTLTLSIGADAAGTRLFSTFSIPAAAAGVTNSVQDFFWYQVMDAAEILTLSAGTNNILVIVVNGDEITLG
tara:strand:+ start:322 stop:666 length:345 start_codon:yes stop_codon:yes gene_type:complete